MGSVEISAFIDETYVGMCIIMVSDGSAPIVSKANNDVWPFVPSDKHLTDGPLESSWVFFNSYDNGRVAISGNSVRITRSEDTTFYAEHLGNRKYHFHTADGRYLAAPKGAANSSPLEISNTPYEW